MISSSYFLDRLSQSVAFIFSSFVSVDCKVRDGVSVSGRLSRRLWLSVRVLEDVVERHVEDSRDLKSHFERRRVPALFDGYDGLARHADTICQIRLGHLSIGEPEDSYGVRNLCWLHHR